MSTSKKAKPGKKVPSREKRKKAVVKKRPVLAAKKKVVAKKPAASRRKIRTKPLALPSFKFDFKILRKKLRSLQSYWAFGLVGSALIVGGGLHYVQQDVAPPAPLAPQVSREVAQAPVAAVTTTTIPTPAAQVEETGPLSKEFSTVRSRELPDRIGFWSDFVAHADSREKLLSIEGAPQIVDTAPLLPTRYDCTTFVETVIALSRSSTSHDFYKNLVSVRYRDGKADYLNRNHFPEIDWIPNNEKAGIVKDVTWDVAEASGSNRRAEKKVIDRSGWIAKQVRRGKVTREIASLADGANSAPVEAIVPYVAIEEVSRTEQNIPDGAVLNIVRKNKDGTPVLITHQGFVIHKDGKAWLRHASVGGNIKTQMLSDYLRELSKKAADKDWPVIGINLNRVL